MTILSDIPFDESDGKEFRCCRTIPALGNYEIKGVSRFIDTRGLAGALERQDPEGSLSNQPTQGRKLVGIDSSSRYRQFIGVWPIDGQGGYMGGSDPALP